MVLDVKDPQYWNGLWKRELLQGARRHDNVEVSIKNSIERWEKRAKPFAENVLGDVGNPRIVKIIDWMQRQGVQLDNIAVLDIGSGPGAFTIPFARQADKVVALEPVKAMADILRAETHKAALSNVEIVEAPWETLNIDERNWRGSFDLVFASMVPGINDMETAEKAIQCSRKYCYISSFAGRRQYRGIVDLWPILFSEEHPSFHLDMQYLMNIVYVRGYAFSLKVWEENREKLLTIDEACDELEKQLSTMIDGKVADTFYHNLETMKTKIRNYVEQHLENGRYLYQSTTRMAAMLIEK